MVQSFVQYIELLFIILNFPVNCNIISTPPQKKLFSIRTICINGLDPLTRETSGHIILRKQFGPNRDHSQFRNIFGKLKRSLFIGMIK